MSRAFIPRHAQAGPRPPFGLLLVAGPELSDAIRVCQRAALRGWSTTIGPWDGREDAPETTAAKYCSAVRVIAQERLDCYLSLKLPALRFDRVLLETVLECASVHGVRVHFDSLGPETASDSLTLLERAARRHRNLSYTLPSRWRRSHDDADTILRLGIPVRVVKGQWPEGDGPEPDPAVGYRRLIDKLRGWAKLVGADCELELLFGLPLSTRGHKYGHVCAERGGLGC